MTHKKYKSAWIACLILCLSPTYAESFNESESLDAHISNKIEILEKQPPSFWNENKLVFEWNHLNEVNPRITKGAYQSKGAAGLIPYIINKNQIYMLLARESWGNDKGTYCDLGGAVEVSNSATGISDSFLVTLIKEGKEESGGLYTPSKEDIFEKAHILSHTYKDEGFYQNFETVLAFFPVNQFYSCQEFLYESSIHAQQLQQMGLCPWSFQEKDDYQWIELTSLYAFLEKKSLDEGIVKNVYNEDIQIKLRPSLLEILRSIKGMQTLQIILEQHPVF